MRGIITVLKLHRGWGVVSVSQSWKIAAKDIGHAKVNEPEEISDDALSQIWAAPVTVCLIVNILDMNVLDTFWVFALYSVSIWIYFIGTSGHSALRYGCSHVAVCYLWEYVPHSNDQAIELLSDFLKKGCLALRKFQNKVLFLCLKRKYSLLLQCHWSMVLLDDSHVINCTQMGNIYASHSSTFHWYSAVQFVL